MIGDVDIFLYASLPESLVNAKVSYLIRQPRGLSSPASEWAGRGLVQASYCSPCLSGDVHIKCDHPLDLNSSLAPMWECAHSVQYRGPFIQQPLDIGLPNTSCLPPHLCLE